MNKIEIEDMKEHVAETKGAVLEALGLLARFVAHPDTFEDAPEDAIAKLGSALLAIDGLESLANKAAPQ